MIDLRLMAVTDLVSSMPWKERVLALIEGGVTVFQLRHKGGISEERLGAFEELHTLLKQKQIPLIVNDSLGLALKIQAEGVHIGENDMAPATARQGLGAHKVLGVSLSSLQSMSRYGEKILEEAKVSYFGIGPIFSTQNKIDADPVIGLNKLKEIQQRIHIPCIAIGGITLKNVRDVFETGVSGVAAIGSLWKAPQPEKSAAQFRQIIDEILLSRSDSEEKNKLNSSEDQKTA